MPHWLKLAILAAIFLLLASLPLARQLELAVIEGQITNQYGPLAGASIEARNVMTAAVRSATSDARGEYKLDGLPPGRYSLWITAAGHCSVSIERISLARGETVRRDVRLNRSAGSSPAPDANCADDSVSGIEQGGAP